MKLAKTPAAIFGLSLAIVGAAALLPRPTFVAADGDDGHTHAEGEGHGHSHGHALHEAMEEMNAHYRQVRRQGRDAAKNADTIEHLHALAVLSLESKAFIPEMADDLPAGERDALAATYRTLMNELVMHLLAAENALLEGDNAAAWESILAANDVKGRGHELFIPEDE
ncbi:MAG: cytochrome b562 [Planctomycetota bacterium]